MRARRIIDGVALLALAGLFGCGGGSSGGGGGSGGMGGIMWPSKDGGSTNRLPPSVKTGRVVFDSESGESCCVAVDPTLLSGSSRRGLAILTDLPVGPATVTVAGFATAFAPTVPGILTTCTTVPADAARPCDPVHVASPAFESPPLSVVILSGVQTDLPEVPIDALPFLLDFSPAQDAIVAPPVQFALTVVDAITGIRADSVNVDVTFNVPSNEPPLFRSITKRVPLEFDPCDDDSNTPCSPSGNLSLTGFKAAGTAPELPVGPVEARITAENLANPPRDLDLRYSFEVLATATATATATPVPTAASASRAVDDAALVSRGDSQDGSGRATTDALRQAGNGTGDPHPPATPTATPTPEGSG